MTEENRNEQGSSEEPQGSGEGATPEVADAGVPVAMVLGDQAKIVFARQVQAAIEYAGANKYEYGPRLRDSDLKWDVVSAETMANDIVRVRLEYSPITSFRGDAGIEYMDVDASGAILARRQIRVPKENKPYFLMGITAFSLILAVVLISRMTIFAPESGDPLYVAGRILWIRAEVPEAQQFILYKGEDTSGALHTWAMAPDDAENNDLVFVEVTLINQTSGTVNLVIDETAADLLDGNRRTFKPINTLDRAYSATDEFQQYNVPGFTPMWGTVKLNSEQQVNGMLVFELPKGSKFSELRWRASDSAVIRYD